MAQAQAAFAVAHQAWQAGLLAEGLAASSVAKCYRLLRTILNTAVEDGLIVANPCTINGAGVEPADERPLPTLVQVAALATEVKPQYLRYQHATAELRKSPRPSSQRTGLRAGFELGEEVEQPGRLPRAIALRLRERVQDASVDQLVDRDGCGGLASPGHGGRHGNGDDRVAWELVDHSPSGTIGSEVGMITELLTPGLLKLLDSAEVALGEVGCLSRSDREALDPLVEVTVSVLGQSVDVAILVGGEDDADRWYVARCESASADQHLDERSPGATVSVFEGVDGLELSVGDGGLDQRGEKIAVAELAQVIEEVGQVLGWRWDEVGLF